MSKIIIALVVAALVVARLVHWNWHRKRKAAARAGAAAGETASIGESGVGPAGATSSQVTGTRLAAAEAALGYVGMVAGREVRERLRGRIFRIGTIVMLLGVGAAVVIPAVNKHRGSSGPNLQKIGVVGTFPSESRQLVVLAAKSLGDSPRFIVESSVDEAKADLKSGRVYFAIIDSSSVLLWQPATAASSPADPSLVSNVAEYIGVLNTYHEVGLTPGQIQKAFSAKPLPTHSLAPASKSAAKATSIIGIILLFFMLTQYCTWTLIGVMQEKSSRVVEVLLAVVRPIQLLGGKVLGIGVVALGQAALIVGFALALGAAVGSDLLKGTAPTALLAELVWLVLGYGFYCWVYAAAGSMAERQDQVQTLALPLSLPILFAYIYSITVVSNGTPNTFFDVLAYLPPTAPFCMSVLVALGKATWWEFLASVLISLVGTAGVALFAARIYRRAVLRTGGRVRFKELLGRTAG